MKRYSFLRENLRVSDENKLFLGVSSRAAGNIWLRVCVGIGFLIISYAFIIGGQANKSIQYLTLQIDLFLKDSGFTVHNINIVGQNRVTNDEISSALSPINISLVRFDIRRARRQIEALPWVETAEITRLFPSTVKISLKERTPFALWQNKGLFFLLDHKGVIISEENIGRWKHLPFLVGDSVDAKAEQFVKLLQKHRGLMNRMHAAKLIAKRRWDLVLNNGVKIQLPETEIASALSELMNLEQQYQILSGNINKIDMRLSDRITLRTSKNRNL